MKTMSRRAIHLLVAAAAMVVGLVVLMIGINHQASPPSVHVAGKIAMDKAAPVPGVSRPPLKPSPPRRLVIPSLAVDTVVNALGLNPDGTLAVPQPGPHLNEAAWFKNSPTPGQIGPSIIEGHVDSVEGKSVFWRLGEIKPGAQIIVYRHDGSRLVFTVNAVRDYAKASFPTATVYGGDLSEPTLRLITCSDFDTAMHHHTGNEVVFARLTHVTR